VKRLAVSLQSERTKPEACARNAACAGLLPCQVKARRPAFRAAIEPFGEHCLLLTTPVVVATPGTGAVYSIAAGLSRGSRADIIAAFGMPVKF
jgi:hypothetical protein